MADVDIIPELKQILGALIFAARRPLSVRELRNCLREVAAAEGGPYAVFAEVTPRDVQAALDDLRRDVAKAGVGFHVEEVAGGLRVQSDAACGKWLRHFLALGKPARLSQPSLETLAIVAYRQPVTRADIEGVRGVAVDHVIRTLMELHLVRIVGRSDLPGRPLLYGTTQTFLEHFGLKDLGDLAEMVPMLAPKEDKGRRARAVERSGDEAEAPTGEPGGGAPAGTVTADGPAGGEAPRDGDEAQAAGEGGQQEGRRHR